MWDRRNRTEDKRRMKEKLKGAGIREGDKQRETMGPRKGTEGFRAPGGGVGDGMWSNVYFLVRHREM